MTLARGGVETSDGPGFGLTALARAAVENSESTYWVAMATLGVGSVFFCRTLMTSALLPRLLAVWGIVGYTIFAIGSMLQLAGYEVGLPLSVPGGLFEVAVGSYLLVKGFGEATQVGADVAKTREHIPTGPAAAAASGARVGVSGGTNSMIEPHVSTERIARGGPDASVSGPPLH